MWIGGLGATQAGREGGGGARLEAGEASHVQGEAADVALQAETLHRLVGQPHEQLHTPAPARAHTQPNTQTHTCKPTTHRGSLGRCAASRSGSTASHNGTGGRAGTPTCTPMGGSSTVQLRTSVEEKPERSQSSSTCVHADGRLVGDCIERTDGGGQMTDGRLVREPPACGCCSLSIRLIGPRLCRRRWAARMRPEISHPQMQRSLLLANSGPNLDMPTNIQI